MIESVEALGRRTSVQTAQDVFATGDGDGKSISKAKRTASEKPSLWISHGEVNKAAGVVAKTTAKSQALDDSLLHRDSDLIGGDEFRRQNGVQEPTV